MNQNYGGTIEWVEEHEFVDGVCKECGEAVVVGTITKVGNTISLDGVVYINHYVKFVDFGEEITKEYIMANGGLLIWTNPLAEADATIAHEAVKVKEGLADGGSNGYMGRTDGVPMKMYADEVYMRAYLKLPNGTYAYGPLEEYSVQDYCEDKITSSKYKQELKDLCASLLHFGAAAQTYFNYNASDLANANIIAEWPVYDYDSTMLNLPEAPQSNIQQSSNVSVYGQTISLDGAILANYYYKTNGIAVATAELLFWEDVAGELTEDNVSYRKTLNYVSSSWHAQGNEIAAKHYGKVVYVCAKFVDSNGNVHYSGVMGYNPDTYAAKKIADNDRANLPELLKRMAVYGEFAKAYFG